MLPVKDADRRFDRGLRPGIVPRKRGPVCPARSDDVAPLLLLLWKLAHSGMLGFAWSPCFGGASVAALCGRSSVGPSCACLDSICENRLCRAVCRIVRSIPWREFDELTERLERIC